MLSAICFKLKTKFIINSASRDIFFSAFCVALANDQKIAKVYKYIMAVLAIIHVVFIFYLIHDRKRFEIE